jgi:hypothetical protein
MILGNVIAIAATARAVSMYAGHRTTGRRLTWLKTSHVFLGTEAHAGAVGLATIGPVRLEGALSVREALALSPGPLVSLVRTLPPREAQTDRVSPVPLEVLRRLPEGRADGMSILPIRIDARSWISLAIGKPLAREHRQWLEERLGKSIEAGLAENSALVRAGTRAYRRFVGDLRSSRSPLGQVLLATSVLDRATVQLALDGPSETGARLGKVLLQVGLGSTERIAEVFEHGRGRHVIDAALAPLTNLRAALSVAAFSRRLSGKDGIFSDLEGDELAAIARDVDDRIDALSPFPGASIRAHALGAPLVARRAPGASMSDGLVVLTSHEPAPGIARRVASLLSAIAWDVPAREEEAHHAVLVAT